jgi:DNA-binding NarL/FixJ family response regulator
MEGGPLPADGCRAIVVGICAFAGLGAPTSVLICDDRPAARQGLAELLRPLPSLLSTRCVSDGFAIVDALAAEPVDLVLIGVHADSDTGREAIGLVLGLHPSTVIIVVGRAGDTDVLVPAYARGARGLLLWEPPPAPEELTDRRLSDHAGRATWPNPRRRRDRQGGRRRRRPLP